MSRQLISLSPDLKALEDDGYEIEIKAGHLVIHNVPYVASDKKVKRGTLVSVLDLAGDQTTKPGTHVMMFAGKHPCDSQGRELHKIKHSTGHQKLADGLEVDHSFSSKPEGGYKDYYDKVVTYVAIISGPAAHIDPNATARTYAVVVSDDPDDVFNYIDSASSRAGIAAVTKKIELGKIAIIGAGGTASYVLDHVVKTPARQIHIFDKDDFLQHNAFRSPGAPSVEELRRRQKKVDYLAGIYSKMHKGIIPHPYHIDASNVHELEGMNFVFICVDNGKAKRPIVEALERMGISFVDVGMGLELDNEQLRGILRVTTSTPAMRDHVHTKNRIGFAGGEVDDLYSKNIQVSELNALNAALAVVKWKKLFGFYSDLDNEHYCTYTLDGNLIINEDKT
jgi:tRNA A37 threonylcarbamoyladenosine dehydratase